MKISQIADPPTASTRRRGCLAISVIIALCLAATIDLLVVVANRNPIWPPLLVLSVGLAVLLWPHDARPPWLTTSLRTIAPALSSAVYTLGVLASGTPTAFGPAEPLILIFLLVVAIRHCRPATAAVAAFVIGASTIALPLRAGIGNSGDSGLAYSGAAILAVLVGGGAALGGYLRSLDHRRKDSIAHTRRTERLSIAADLHDFVAHHVTGILVQAQMARALAITDPDRLDPVLESIEHAAGEALGAMRRTVGILRTSGTDQPAAGNLAAIGELVSGFAASRCVHATLHRGPNVPDTLPPEVQAAAYRVVQEALTNVGRHAPDATETTIDLRCDDNHLQVTVRNNGTIRPTWPTSARTGHYGLIGLSERVNALGGHFHAGPQPTEGWRLTARLPTNGTAIRRPAE
ncbi:sensor histidine kinase [Micromonospora sp. KC723]|uniref:sensor histidine kinase n=1 Tax=Micromonospora sp. KC723 TaxID=2530381 RepID=UPI00104C3046|nr:sensor histidine kinase [Micromonospora sp. KC723]TDB78355.1 sensor histidine kinase [Micromonospora sp. KC723]